MDFGHTVAVSFWKGCTTCGPTNWFHKWWCPELTPWVEILAVGSVLLLVVNILGDTEPRSGWPLSLVIVALFVPLSVARRLWAGRRPGAGPDDDTAVG
jgi:hypothetical protein